jgi:hypothetical protein
MSAPNESPKLARERSKAMAPRTVKLLRDLRPPRPGGDPAYYRRKVRHWLSHLDFGDFLKLCRHFEVQAWNLASALVAYKEEEAERIAQAGQGKEKVDDPSRE